MAYAAVISLKQTIHRLLHSSHTPIVSSSREILEYAYKHITSLQEFLQKFYDSSSRRWNSLDVKIRDAVQKVEDAVESNVSNQFLSLPDGGLDLEEATQEIRSFVENMTKMKEDYNTELQNLEDEDEDEDEDDGAVSSNDDIGFKMVGLSNEFSEIRDRLLKPMRPYDFGIFSFVGKLGSLRSIVAKTLFDEIFVAKEQPFDCGAWVRIGKNYQFTEILVNILAQIDYHELPIVERDVEKIGRDLYASLKDRRYMIVIDDIDDVEVWDYLRIFFPEQDNGSLIVMTTGLIEVAQFAKSFYIHEMPTFLDDYVWDYLRLVMFGIEKTIDPEFEKAGKKIAKNCGGSLIALARVIPFLFKAEKTPEYWSKLAAEEQHSIFAVEDEISEVCKIKEDVHAHENFTATGVLDLSAANNIIKEFLFPQRYFPQSEIMLFYGMAGIGKTTFLRNIFEDSSISHHFDHRVWIHLGPKYKAEEILVDILVQIYPDIDRERVKEDSKLAAALCAKLSCKRCFIVLDDMWKPDPIYHLKTLLPDIKAAIYVTTRLLLLGPSFGPDDRYYKVRLLNKEESWDLLRQKVFARGSFPPELEKVGKKISKNCEGLPLLIVTIAHHLSKAEKTLKYWNMVIEGKNSVFEDAYDQMHKVLYPSYEYLPQHLKACFLYMGAFPRNYEIPTSKLIALWDLEGFLEPDLSQTVEDFAKKCLKEIVYSSLVIVQQKHYDPKSSKTCRLHSVFWHLCSSEAEKSKFFNTYARYSIEGLKETRRVCIRNNILLGVRHEHNSMSSISYSRSILCTGPHHQYPVPIPYRSSLLRILDAMSIRLYEFPIEVVELIHLRYLALTCIGRLPTSISKLRNLENLIIGRHLSTKSSRDSSILPIEIWSMKELKYLRVTGCNIPNPSSGEVLANLSTLLDVSIDSCTKEVLQGVPNLKRLGVQIELEPDDDDKPFHYLNHISSLIKLETLKCVVVNPDLSHDVVTPPSPHSMFPPSLKKLSLSGLGYPWSYMDIIGRLQNLEVLKLRCYAFQGPIWETDYASFSQLKFLSFEDTDLVRWRTRNHPPLKYLSIKHCYKLEELPNYLPISVETLQVADCSPSVVTWAEQMKQNDLEKKVEKLTTVDVHSSWDDWDIK